MNKPHSQYTLYIGLNDSVTGEQKFDTEKYVGILKNVCRIYKVAFSVQQINGGYFHEDGRYTEENSLVLTLMGVPEDTVYEIARDLCTFFHQESIMVTGATCSVVFVNDSLSDRPLG